MITIILRNDFHSRECRVRVPSLPHTISPRQIERIERLLCGHHDCTCGVIRGPQDVQVTVGAGDNGGLLIEANGA